MTSHTRGFDPAFLTASTSSFSTFLTEHAPELLPTAPTTLPTQTDTALPHGTTIVAVAFEGGVVMAGDRRATSGNLIANRTIDKVFVADESSLVGISGVAGVATEMVSLFQVELEHYEKIEGTPLSLEGRANRLRTMIRGNLPLALRGLGVIPLYAGHDGHTGRIFSYDIAGGCYEEHDYAGVGSGSLFARGALKKLWHPALDADTALHIAIEALYDAADDDTATGGPDIARRLWPTCALADTNGARLVADTDIATIVENLVADRRHNPGGAR